MDEIKTEAPVAPEVTPTIEATEVAPTLPVTE